jgi:hypothetical protein
MNTPKLPSFAASKLSKAIFLIALPLIIGLTGCEFDRPEAEGRIYYELSFPFLEGNILENVFPTEMVLSFKDDRMTGEIRSLGGIMKTSFITDNDAKTIQQMLKNYSDYTYASFDEQGLNKLLSSQPGVRIESTNDSALVAGYKCAVSIAYFLIDSVPPIQLFHTNQIDIEEPNWYTQFNELNEVLLGYEVEQFGMRMKLMATQVIKCEVPEASFVVDQKYKEVTGSQLSEQLKTLLNEYLED